MKPEKEAERKMRTVEKRGEWKRLEVGWVKVICDGAFKRSKEDEERGEAGIWVVIGDENGFVIGRVAKKVDVKTSIEAEAAALREGVWLAERMKQKRIILEMDSETLYREINERRVMRCWKIQPYIKDI